jgi:hypothetical protein
MTANYKVCIDDIDYSINDSVVTGQQLLDLANNRPTKDFLIFQLLSNGQLEEIRLDETTDLRKQGIEKFITFRSDRSFFFMLDGRRFQWGASFITGFQLKKLANVDPKTYAVWQETSGLEDRKIEDRDVADLTKAGVESFFTGKSTTTEG